MAIKSKRAKLSLWLVVTAVVCIGVGFAAGALTTTFKLGQASRIDAIKENLFTIKSLESSPRGFEKVLLLSTRTRITTAVCYQYADSDNERKYKIKVFVDEYNAVVGKSNNNLLLPPIRNMSDASEVRSAYCAIKS